MIHYHAYNLTRNLVLNMYLLPATYLKSVGHIYTTFVLQALENKDYTSEGLRMAGMRCVY